MSAIEAARRLHLDSRRIAIEEPGPTYNAPPGTNRMVAIGRPTDPSHIEITRARWGFLPSWQKTVAKDSKWARSDQLDSKYWYRAAQLRRCVIPASWWYEWKPYAPPNKGKQPHVIRPRDTDGFFIAGLWSVAKSATMDRIRGCQTFAVVTQPPAPEIAHIKDRMPVALDDEGAQSWLAENNDIDQLRQIIDEHTFRGYYGYPCTTAVNSPRNNDASVLEPMKDSARG